MCCVVTVGLCVYLGFVAAIVHCGDGGGDCGRGVSRQTAMRAQKLRHNGAFVSDEAFHMRKAHFNRKKEGALREKVRVCCLSP